MLDKLHPFELAIAKEAITEMHDRFIEGVVYLGEPSISAQVNI
jgi:hypothetical protein